MDISVVIPVFNEAPVLEELLKRVSNALEPTGVSHEILLVDDSSTDATPKILEKLSEQYSELRPLRTPRQSGQFRTTKYGLARARGRWVITMDGDLQDPPEVIGRLMDEMRNKQVDTVFAVKSDRKEAPWFLVGQAVYHYLQHRLTGLPMGAGSFLITQKSIARAIASVSLKDANIAVLIQVFSNEIAQISYEKSRRYDSNSRVGFYGLLKEAMGSLFLSGALHRLTFISAGMVLLSGVFGVPSILAVPTALVLVGVGSALLIARQTLIRDGLKPMETQ